MKKKTLMASLVGLCITITSVIVLSSFSNHSVSINNKSDSNILAHKFTNTSAYNVTVQNGMLYFASVADYIGVMSEENSTQGDFKAFVSGLSGFTSLLNGSTSELKTALGDEYISYIINSNGCVRIGGNVYKVSNNHNSVLVLNSSNINSANLADLYSETSNSNILVYSSADGVIDLVENGIPPSGAAERCSESGAGERSDQSGRINFTDPNGSTGWFEAKIFHKRAGIYFSLRATVAAQTTGNCQRQIQIHKDPVHYKRRCSSWFGHLSRWNDVIINGITNAGDSGDYYGYISGTTPLNAYKFRIVFMAKHWPDPVNVPDPSADLIIRVNL